MRGGLLKTFCSTWQKNVLSVDVSRSEVTHIHAVVLHTHEKPNMLLGDFPGKISEHNSLCRYTLLFSTA